MLSSGVDKALAAQEQRNSTAAGQIRWVLRHYLGGRQPDISDVAREPGMSSRTLQRRIVDEGTNFRRILNQERHELAKHYLPQPALELNEVAYLLGYEDPNSFIRVFREWEVVRVSVEVSATALLAKISTTRRLMCGVTNEPTNRTFA